MHSGALSSAACLQSGPWKVDVGTTPGVNILETSREGVLAVTVAYVFYTDVQISEVACLCEELRLSATSRGEAVATTLSCCASVTNAGGSGHGLGHHA